MSLNLDLRDYIRRQYDEEERGWVPVTNIQSCFERNPIEISSFLNQQEISTLLKQFSQNRGSSTNSSSSNTSAPSKNSTVNSSSQNSSPKYYYHELCDLLSKRYYIYIVRTGRKFRKHSQPSTSSVAASKKSMSDLLSRFLTDLRSRKTNWRR